MGSLVPLVANTYYVVQLFIPHIQKMKWLLESEMQFHLLNLLLCVFQENHESEIRQLKENTDSSMDGLKVRIAADIFVTNTILGQIGGHSFNGLFYFT